MFNFFKSTTKISPSEAKELIRSQKAVLIDVRTKEEYKGGHIDKSVNIPLNTLTSVIQSKYPDKSKHIIVMCHSGARSKEAFFALQELGYTNVSDLGGIISWPYSIIA